MRMDCWWTALADWGQAATARVAREAVVVMAQAVTARAAREVAWESGRVAALVQVRALDRVPAMAQVVETGQALATGRVAAMAGFAKGQVLTG